MNLESASFQFHPAALADGITAESGEEMHRCATQLGHANRTNRSTAGGVIQA